MSKFADVRSLLRSLPVFTVALPEFDVEHIDEDPSKLFLNWLAVAIEAGVREPHAATLSTVDVDGRPDARVLILKDLDTRGWWFTTNATSPKGRQLGASPSAALTFYWSEMGRQVRVRGTVVKASQQESADDFRERGIGARSVALASHESTQLASLEDCRIAVAQARERLEVTPDLVSSTWTLYALVPREIEFWQADRDRQHVRIRYEQRHNIWRHDLLWP